LSWYCCSPLRKFLLTVRSSNIVLPCFFIGLFPSAPAYLFWFSFEESQRQPAHCEQNSRCNHEPFRPVTGRVCRQRIATHRAAQILPREPWIGELRHLAASASSDHRRGFTRISLRSVFVPIRGLCAQARPLCHGIHCPCRLWPRAQRRRR